MYVIFHSALTHGHLNVCIAIGKELQARGHRVSFVVTGEWVGKLAADGFEELVLTLPPTVSNDNENSGTEATAKASETLRDDEKIRADWVKGWRNPCLYERHKGEARLLTAFLDLQIAYSELAVPLIRQEKPDFLMVDNLFKKAYLEKSGIPWARVFSCNPLFRDPLGLPTGYCGLPADSTKEDWDKARTKRSLAFDPLLHKLNEWYEREGVPKVERFFANWHSPYINFYLYPQEIDYATKEVPMEGNWIRIDSTIEGTDEPITLPESFRQLPGRTLYLSMGTLACADVPLIQRLLDILEQSKHKVIVSKGPNGDLLRMPANAWGENFLPQKKVLPVTDLLIGHGGNNTFVEALHYGIPMLLSPFFGDQPDNAQRARDMKLGDRFNAYDCDADELLQSIDRILADEEVLATVQRIAKRLQSRSWIKLAVDSFEAYVSDSLSNHQST